MDNYGESMGIQSKAGKVQASEKRELCVDGVIVYTRGGDTPSFPFSD